MVYLATVDLEQKITQLGLKTVLVASLIMIVSCAIAILLKNRHKALKLPLFIVMASTLVLTTGILFGSTIYLNVKSESGGPVHWHTDIEFWACGTELNLRNPKGALSNKVGTSTYHEHNDKRIHLEGVVVRKAEDASLEKFMKVSGGYIHDDGVGIPLSERESDWLANEEQQDGDLQGMTNVAQLNKLVTRGSTGAVMELKDGQKCGSETAEVQAFVYRYDEKNKSYSQTKLQSPKEYIMRDESTVPPGDCVIVEYDKPKQKTDKLCRQYGVRDQKRCKAFGVKESSSELCNLHETTGGTN